MASANANSTTETATTSPALGFATLDREAPEGELALTGELPSWLSGSLLRTGPAKFEVGESRMRHWFDGLAMLHRFTITDGRVSYANRALQSRAYRTARERGRIAFGEFATDPCRSLFKRVQSLFVADGFSDNGNVNVGRLGERFMAMTETQLPVEFDPRTLDAAGVHPYRAPGQLSTAHPHRDRGTKAMLNYAAQLGPRSSYRFFAVGPNDRAPRVLATLPVSRPAYMHSFGLTEHWFVIAEFPFVVNPVSLVVSGRPYIENYRWRPERGTRLTLVERASGRVRARFETDACFAFHHVNAFERDGEVVADICTYPDATVVEDLYLDRLRQGKPVARATPTRFRLDLDRGAVTRQALSDGGLELPRINYDRCNERPYRYVWGNSPGPTGWLEQIVKVDTSQGQTHSWSEPGCYPGEPVFVARPDAQAEDDGVLLSVVLDAASGVSFLLVLDAAELDELARAQAPHHIPFGFHGQFARG